jgi:hypothetical protein
LNVGVNLPMRKYEFGDSLAFDVDEKHCEVGTEK